MAIQKFNTGRKYTAQGQIIFWEQQPDGTVWMNDVSRGVDYALSAPASGLPANETYVLRGYDDRRMHAQYNEKTPEYWSTYYVWVNSTRILPRD